MKLQLIVYPHDSLRKKAEPVKDFDKTLHDGLKQMESVLKCKKGLGLAAPQVNWNIQCFFVKFEDKVHVFINPQLISVSDEVITYEEGCLSVPGVYADVIRPKEIRIQAQDRNGNFFELTSDSFFARIILHEYDHLQGVLFFDHLPKNMNRRMIKEYQVLQKQSN